MNINFNNILSIIKNNLLLKILSLVFAIAIWLVVVQYVNPEDTRRIENIKIQVITEKSVPEREGLVLVTDYDKTLSITYEATRDVIYTINPDKITAYVDLSSAKNSGEYSFPVKIDTGGQNIKIIDQSVKEATLKFEKGATAQIRINATVEGAVDDGYIKNDPVCVPSVLNIEGPESKISKIVSAEVKVSENKFSKTNVYSCGFQFVDENGSIISNDYIISDADKVDVTVTVLKTKVLPITATIANSSGGHDSTFAILTMSPGAITVAGSEEMLATLNSYDIGTIDVSDKTSDYQFEHTVSLQNGIVNVEGIMTVNVGINFEDLRTKTIKFSNFEIENLPEGLKADVIDKSLNITFRGIADDISKISTDNVRIVADFNNKNQTKGINRVPVYVVIPETYKVGVSGKYEITVNIS